MKKKVAAVIAVIVFGSGLASAQWIKAVTPPSARSFAMGGHHAALADDFSVLFSNPAGLTKVKPELFIAQAGVRASGPIFDIAGALVGGGDILNSLLAVLKQNGNKLYAGADIAGPLAFGYVGRGLGFGFFNRTQAVADATSLTSISANASEQMLLVGGYGFGIDLGGSSIDFGLLAKGYMNGELVVKSSVFDIESVIAKPLGQPFRLITGIGIDAGLLWSMGKTAAIGISFRDAFSPALVTSYTSYEDFVANPSVAKTGAVASRVRPDLSVGVSYTPKLGSLAVVFDRLLFALDYSDILDLTTALPRNAILNVGLGMEAKVLDILYLRAGIADALLSAGIALDLSIFRLNASAWGTELGLEPGQRSVYNLLISVEFRF